MFSHSGPCASQCWSWSALVELGKLAYFVYACGAQRYVGYIRRKIAMARRFTKVGADCCRRHYEMALINYPVTLVETSPPRASNLHYLDSYCAVVSPATSTSTAASSTISRPLFFSVNGDAKRTPLELHHGSTNAVAESPSARRKNT